LQLLQLLLSGIAQGCIYGLIALGFVLIYKATETVSFAQGELMMLGAFFAFAAMSLVGMPFWLAAVLAVIAMGAFGVLLELVVIRPILGQPQFSIVMLTMFVIISWKYFGFHMILLLAGLQGIPRELEEAASIDGASNWQAIRRVTLPLLGPTIRVSVFLSMIGALQLFDLIWVTTRGGPVNASNTMATYMVDWGFRRSQLGYGSATAVILFSAALVVALLYQRFVMRRDIDGAITTTGG